MLIGRARKAPVAATLRLRRYRRSRMKLKGKKPQKIKAVPVDGILLSTTNCGSAFLINKQVKSLALHWQKLSANKG